MPQFEVIPLSPLDGSNGFAFSVQRDGNPCLLLDAGRGEESPDWIQKGAAHDTVWISHGHHDHAGALPELLQDHPQIDVVLPAKAASLAAAIAIAGGTDASRAHAMFDNAQKRKFHEPFELAGGTAIAGPSGHGVGAGLLRIDFDTRAIGYTGDWALHPRTGTQPAADHKNFMFNEPPGMVWPQYVLLLTSLILCFFIPDALYQTIVDAVHAIGGGLQ